MQTVIENALKYKDGPMEKNTISELTWAANLFSKTGRMLAEIFLPAAIETVTLEDMKEVSLVSSILSDHYMDSLTKAADIGYIACLDVIAEWALDFYMVHKNYDWEKMFSIVSENPQYPGSASWDDVVVAYGANKMKELTET